LYSVKAVFYREDDQEKKEKPTQKKEGKPNPQKKLNKIKKSTLLPENFGFLFQNLRARLKK